MLPLTVRAALESHFGQTIQDVVPLSGGMINQVAKVTCANGPLLVKWNLNPPTGLFAAEAAGLQALTATGTICIPDVLLHDEQEVPFLVLEYLPPAPIRDAPRFAQRFAAQLAALHHQGSTEAQFFGGEQDNFLGVFPQPNRPRRASWPDFYRECRLLPQIQRAQEIGHLPPPRARLLNRVIEQLPLLLADLPPERSLLHGDLWAGNFLCLPGDQPALIDPAVYIGPREMELAYIELFGGFPPGFAEAYNDAWPLPHDYARRRPLHQLYPLLVHLNCFGEKYGPWVEQTCQMLLQ